MNDIIRQDIGVKNESKELLQIELFIDEFIININQLILKLIKLVERFHSLTYGNCIIKLCITLIT